MRYANVGTWICLCALLYGCATMGAQGTVEVPVPVPCQVPNIKKPALPVDALTGVADIFTIVKSLWASDLLRQGYEQELEAALQACAATAPVSTR